MRKLIFLPILALMSACGDGSATQDLVAPEPLFAKATAQDQIAALGCDAYWLDYSDGPPPNCSEGSAVCLSERRAWFADHIHREGFTVKGRSIYGTEHRDKILCHPGGNRTGAETGVRIYGMGGDDRLIGGAGDDIISGGKGCDGISGGNGNDVIDGGPGNDLPGHVSGGCKYLDRPGLHLMWLHGLLEGDEGDDVLLGGPGKDHLDGGDGFDECDVGPPGEDDTANCEIVGG